MVAMGELALGNERSPIYGTWAWSAREAHQHPDWTDPVSEFKRLKAPHREELTRFKGQPWASKHQLHLCERLHQLHLCERLRSARAA